MDVALPFILQPQIFVSWNKVQVFMISAISLSLNRSKSPLMSQTQSLFGGKENSELLINLNFILSIKF